MLKQRPNSDKNPILPTKRTYTRTIYVTLTRHYLPIHRRQFHTHTYIRIFHRLFFYTKASNSRLSNSRINLSFHPWSKLNFPDDIQMFKKRLKKLSKLL